MDPFRVYKRCTLKSCSFVTLYYCTSSFPILNTFINKTPINLLNITQIKMSVIAVAGGTGNVGLTIVETLAKSSNCKVIVLGRKVQT